MSLTHDDVIRILELLRQSQFENLDYEEDGLRLTLRASPDSWDAPRPSLPGTEGLARSGGQPRREQERAASPEPVSLGIADADGDETDHEIVSVLAPVVGTFYAAPKPEAPPFVEPGDTVDVDSTLGLIELMKMFTAIKAELKGRVEQVLVDNGDFVEYGQELFKIMPYSE